MKYLLALAIGVVTIWSFLVPDAALFQRPELARIFFWHFPCPMMLTAFLFLGCYFSFRYFVRMSGPAMLRVSTEDDQHKRRLWDARATAAIELGLVYGILTLVTGMLFSVAQWGAMWQWDARQTSYLIALLIYAAYFALRAAFTDPEKRAANAAAYMLAATLPIVFLIYVFPRLPYIEANSFHPTDTVMEGRLKGQYAYVTIAVLALVGVLNVWLYRLRIAVGLLEIKLTHGQLETVGGGAAPSAVVRPVRLSDDR